MPDEEVVETTEEKKEEKPGIVIPWLKIFMITWAVILIATCAYFAYFIPHFVYETRKGEPVPYDADIYKAVDSAKKSEEIPEFFDISPREGIIRIDITEDDVKVAEVKLDLSLAYDANNRSLANEIEENQVRIIDEIIYFIGLKQVHELSTVENRVTYLKKEIMIKVNSILRSGRIRDVLFKKFYIDRVSD